MSHEELADVDPELIADPLEEDPKPNEPSPDVARTGSSTASIDRSPAAGLAPYDPFRRYMAEIAKYPPLAREEEQALARRFRETGDREALLRLITANLMLVVRIALSFRRAARNLLDLIQEGNIGLLQAIQRFDPELGVRLPTYAAWWVRAYMVKFLLDNVRLVRVGTTNARRKLLRNLRKEKARLEARGFEVGPRLLAEHFDVSEQDVIDVEAALSSRDVSLDAPTGADEGRPRSEIMADESRPGLEEEVERRELQQRVERALARFRQDLNERELALLDERILSETPLTLQALGDRFGTTREAVRQAETRLMARLKRFLSAEFGEDGRVILGSR